MTLDHERKHATRSCPMILCVLAALLVGLAFTLWQFVQKRSESASPR